MGSVPSDEELVARIRAGDEQATSLLFTRHFESLRPLIRRHLAPALRRRIGESDIVQETYCRVVDALDTFVDRGPGSYRRWLRGILVHVLKDTVKWHSRRRRAVAREVDSSHTRRAASRQETPSAAASRRDEEQKVREALARIDASDAALLEWVHRAGHSFVEIAERTGKTPDAVRKAYGRALVRVARLRRTSDDGV